VKLVLHKPPRVTVEVHESDTLRIVPSLTVEILTDEGDIIKVYGELLDDTRLVFSRTRLFTQPYL
jgi:hypothetical protein